MKIIYTLAALVLAVTSSAQSLYFPPLSGAGWDTLPASSQGYCVERIDSLYQYLDANHTKAFILLQDGKIVLEKYFNGHDATTAWQWASAGKTITAFLTGIAQQEGKLRITDTSSKYLGAGWTSLTPAQEAAITIRHQLSMTSGLDDGVADSDCTADTCLLFKAAAGTRWAYHNAPYTLLGSVIQAATGQNLNTYATQKLKNPTGMTGAFFPVGDNEVFFSTARSFARFGLLILNRGSWNGTPLLTDTAYFRAMTNSSQVLNPSYGYLWWLNGKSAYMIPQLQVVINGPLNPHAPSDAITAMGKDGQFLNVVPSRNLVWIRMGEAPDGLPVPFLMNDRIWEYVAALKCAATSVASPAGTEPVRVTPNPARRTVQLFTASAGSLALTDMQGRLVLRVAVGAGTTAVDLGGLPGGTYLLAFAATDGMQHRQLLQLR